MVDIYRPDVKMTDLISKNRFTISAEVIPPRNGSPQSSVLNQVQSLVNSGAEFLSVTKGAGGSLRGGSLPIAQAIKDHFKKPAIAHFTCRDLTPEDVENQLMDHHYFGIRNILALRGDPPVGIPDWTPVPKAYPYAYQLIEQIKKLNAGQFLERKGFTNSDQTRTDFSIGAAAYPEDNEATRVEHFVRKVEAGAEYGITQMLYSVDHYSRFIEDLAKKGKSIPILPGARILKSKAQALRMATRFNIQVPAAYLERLPEQEDLSVALDLFQNLIEDFKKAGAPGLHLFVLTDTEASCALLKRL